MNLKPTFKTLNPHAPEYKPIPPGVTPHHQNAPLPSFLPPSSSAAFQQLRPSPPSSCFLPRQVFTYIPQSTTQQPFYTNYNTPYYVVTPQNPFTRNPPPPPPPPPPPRPRQPQGRRSSTIQKRRLPAGGGVGSSRNKADQKNGRGHFSNFKFEKRALNTCSTRSMHRDGKEDKVMPLNRDEEKTTLMIKNIPYDCPRKELISLIDVFCLLENVKARNEGTSSASASADQENFISAYDFLYLPVDFRTKKSRGFAFVNFTNATTVWKFFQAFHQKNWDFIQRTSKWTKKIEVVTAKIQGKEALVNHFSESIFECETDEFLPLSFNPPRNGSGQPGQLTAIGSRRSTATSSPWKPRHNHKP